MNKKTLNRQSQRQHSPVKLDSVNLMSGNRSADV